MDLNEPLGMRPPRTQRRRGALIIAWSLAAAALVGIGAFFITADPHGGEPYAVASIPRDAKATAALALGPDTAPTGSLPTPDAARLDPGSLEGGVKVFRGSNGGSAAVPAATGPQIIDVTKMLDDPLRKREPSAGVSFPAPALVTTGAGTNGGTVTVPRVAIFVEGMGLSESATRTATEIMPPAVDLAFVPYGDKIGAAVAAAKSRGHEIVLQIPMDTTLGARSGPHALRADEPQGDLAADINWLTTRFSGYAGVCNLLGASVTSNNATMTTLLKSVASRRLFYLDDSTSKHSVAASLAPNLGVTVLRADVVIDATSDPNVVRANLDRLEAIARQNGQAIGMASGLPDHLAAIAQFAGDLAGRGVTLVPVSALTSHDASVATAR